MASSSVITEWVQRKSPLFPYTTLFRSSINYYRDALLHARYGGQPEGCPYKSTNFSFLRDRKSTRLNSSHSQSSYAVFCLKNKKWVKRKTPDHATTIKNTELAQELSLPP